MPKTTINLNSEHEMSAIAIITAIHDIYPAARFKDPSTASHIFAYTKTDELVDILRDFDLAYKEAEKMGEPWDWDILWAYVQQKLLMRLPEIKDERFWRS